MLSANFVASSKRVIVAYHSDKLQHALFIVKYTTNTLGTRLSKSLVTRVQYTVLKIECSNQVYIGLKSLRMWV